MPDEPILADQPNAADEPGPSEPSGAQPDEEPTEAEPVPAEASGAADPEPAEPKGEAAEPGAEGSRSPDGSTGSRGEDELPRLGHPSASLRAAEALERLDRQWEDRTPIRERSDVSALGLTVPEDPTAFDYLGAMGVAMREVVEACQTWLEAQLAADALDLGRRFRPVVALVPAGRLWHVIRMAFGRVVVIDGPGYLSPVAAVRAARIRYRALLADEVQRHREEDGLDDQEPPSLAPEPEPGAPE
ncbi:MAG TPA: hypothetical protein VKR30_01110 [Candidatus Limnocylindrales bacterium]|nr:hypothetical protein [Candidatus Limnocylindrales bacterium]